MKIQYNREMSVIDTEVKAYMLGMLYADGCITNKGNYQKHVRLSLADKELIDKLYILFPFFNYEKWDFGMYNKNCVEQFSLRKTCKELYNDLKTNGLVERKSTDNRENLKLPKLSENLINHFIRGFFDGDGSVYKQKNRPNGMRAEICSVSKSFMEELCEVFKKENINFWKLREKNPSGRGKLVTYSIEWTKGEDTVNLGKFLYKNATIFLGRKKLLFDSFKIKNKMDENPQCPMCKCLSCSKKGERRKTKTGIKRRYFCKNCNKGYTIAADLKLGELLENL